MYESVQGLGWSHARLVLPTPKQSGENVARPVGGVMILNGLVEDLSLNPGAARYPAASPLLPEKSG
jgi:hypothetical protein